MLGANATCPYGPSCPGCARAAAQESVDRASAQESVDEGDAPEEAESSMAQPVGARSPLHAGRSPIPELARNP